MSRIIIQPLTALNALMRWRIQVIRSVFGVEPDTKLLEANRGYYSYALSEGLHIACEALIDGVPAGCGGVCFSDELPSPDNASGRCGYLMNIYVEDSHRRMGIGHEIVKWLIAKALERGCDKIYLESTAGARSLYESLGFRPMNDLMIYKP